jgi:aminomethyltransferase
MTDGRDAATSELLATPFSPRYADGVEEWVDVYGYGAPAVLSDPAEEHRAVRENVGVMDFSMLYKVDVEGPRALEMVNELVTRNVSTLASGRIAYGAIVDERGMMVDDCTTIAFGPEHVRVTGGSPVNEVLLRERADGTRVRVSQRRQELAHLCVQGPRSRELLQSLTASDLSNSAFPYYTYLRNVAIRGIPVHLNRMGFTAELGYEVWVAAEDALALWDAIFAAGVSFGLRQVGVAAIMMLRIEAGMVMGEGLEYDDTVSPFECGLGWAVDFDKPAFRGRDALLTLREAASNRLVTVRLPEGDDAATGAPLLAGDRHVGHITMSAVSPVADATLGLARVDRDQAAPGTALTAEFDGRLIPAEVVPTPVYDPERARVRS